MVTMVGTQNDLEGLMYALIELDYDAVEAYEAAIERLENPMYRATMINFKNDHIRHISELSVLCIERGITPPNGPDMKRFLTKGKAILGGLIGDRAILMAMKTNEDDTNTAYARAVEHPCVSMEIRQVCNRNLDDERRHRAWIKDQIATAKRHRHVDRSHA